MVSFSSISAAQDAILKAEKFRLFLMDLSMKIAQQRKLTKKRKEIIVVRITNKPRFCAYKHKNFAFKCLEGIVKTEATEPDIEEAQEETIFE